MKTIVKINDKKTNKNITENVFENKSDAMNFIKSLPKDNNTVVFGNYMNNGKNFFFGF